MTTSDTSHTCAQCGLVYARGGVRLRSEGAHLHFCCSGCAVTNSILGASAEEGESAVFLARLGLSAFLSMNIMAVSWMVYDRGFATFGLTDDVLPAFEALLLVLSIPVMLLVGVPYAFAAWRELRTLSVSTDSLIALGSFSAFAFSTYQYSIGGRGIYYDTATMTLVLVTLGRYIEATAKGNAQRSLRELLELQPPTARLERNGEDVVVAADDVSVGQIVRVLAGERIPLDGVILEGSASVDESPLTGESMPRHRQPGDRVLAATLALDGSILVTVSSPSTESAHTQAVRLLEEARATRSPLQRTVDRISAAFIPVVILLAAAATIGWSFLLPLEHALINGMTVLVVSCPCALGIGTPLALTYALQRAAQEGVLIRTHDAMERLSSVRTVLFDKTGTLTSGLPSVSTWLTRDPVPEGKRVIASLEAHSTHPIGRGIVRSARVEPSEHYPAREVRVLPGTGIEGEVLIQRAWHHVRIIHARDEVMRSQFLRLPGSEIPPEGDESEVYAFMDGQPYAIIRVADTIRSDARDSVAALHAASYTTALLSGDDHRAVGHVAERCGISDAHGELLPADKLDHIRRFSASGPTVMVGDGINDAPSLAAADVGIAMAGGTDIAKESSDVVIVGDLLIRVPWLLHHARRTISIIRWNLFWAFGYNIVAIALAVAGLLQPVFAAAAMVISSVTIIAHSRRAAGTPSDGVAD